MYDSPQCFSMESLLNENISDEETLLQDIMKQRIDKMKYFYLPNEIELKKKQIYDLFIKKFGKTFFNIKPESLLKFEKLLQKFLFDPKSEFLHHFPALQKKLQGKKKIDEEKLKSKINIGNMLFYDLRDRKNKLMINNINSHEKLLSLSKNFASNKGKDVINNQFYKIKFWDKNSKRIDKIIAKKNKSKKDLNTFESKNEEAIKHKTNSNEELILNNENDENNNKSVENLLLNKFDSDQSDTTKNINNNLRNSNNNITNSPNRGTGGYKRLFLLNKTENSLYHKFLNSKSNINNTKKLKPQKNFFNSIKINNNSKLRESIDYISRNKDRNNLDFIKTHGNFKNLKLFSYNKTKNLTDIYNKFNFTPKINSSFFNTEKETRKRSSNFKTKFDNEIKKLNNQTFICNHKLYKLIDGNNTEIIPSKPEISNMKVDLIELFHEGGKKQHKKPIKNENIKKIVTDIKNEEENKKNRRNLRKKINQLPEDLALKMAEHSIGDKYKEINMNEILRDVKRKKTGKKKQKLDTPRKKLEKNYKKIIRLHRSLYYENLRLTKTKVKKAKSANQNCGGLF